MIRREFIKSIGLSLIASLIPANKIFSQINSSKKFNVLFIAVDDLNDWVGCLGGHPDVKTPNIDKFARNSVCFTKAYCAAPECNPSRASLLTGIRPSKSGVYRNNQPWRYSPKLANAVTLPQLFRDNGYKAMGSGKIFHGGYEDPQSWDYYWPSKEKSRPTDPMPTDRPLNGIPNTNDFDWGAIDVKKEDMSDWKVTNWVINELNKEQEKPFFLACGIFRPHLPWYVPKEYFDIYPLDNIKLPEVYDNDLVDIPDAGKKMARITDHRNVLKYHQWKRAVQGYLACISFADECVGRVLEALETSKYKDSTVVVLWSDHGWHLGQKLHWRKFSLWEEATHNVFMMSAPGISKDGNICDSPVNLLDIYPTLTDICQLRPPKEIEGLSLIKLLKDPDAKWDTPSLSTYKFNNHAIRSKRWRYIRYNDGSEELYDHENDNLEWTNLAHGPIFKPIIDELRKWLPKENANPIPVKREFEENFLKKLINQF